MTLRRLALMAFAAAVVSACQTTPPPPPPQGKSVTVGEWTVSTGGYVRADAGVTRGH